MSAKALVKKLKLGGELSLTVVSGLLLEAIEREGGQAALARKLGMSPAYMNDVYLGRRRMPAKLLDFLGVERVEIYRKKGSA